MYCQKFSKWHCPSRRPCVCDALLQKFAQSITENLPLCASGAYLQVLLATEIKWPKQS